MARPMKSSPARPRISLDVEPRLRRRLRWAAAKRDVSIRQYVLYALEEQLHQDLAEEEAMTSKTDPVLADLWDNPKDSAYDEL